MTGRTLDKAKVAVAEITKDLGGFLLGRSRPLKGDSS